MESLTDAWHNVFAHQARPDTSVILVTAAVAAAAVLYLPSWRIARHVVTIAHEAAHGIAAVACGRRLSGIRLHSDTSGVTVSSGKRTGPGMVLTAAAGYIGPALIGLGAALTLSAGYALAVLWGVLVLLALLLIQIRNWFGLWSVLASAGVVFAVTWWAPESVQSGFAYLVTWFLLVSAPRPVIELQLERRRRRTTTSDADQLARLTVLPAVVWVGVFILVTLGALVGGAIALLQTS
ncbi:M50 family metallopeptidase [Solicola gregarius]|uniref:M50 family metallopeptidase n=1 Tax=Solicola gregarius TaxID=2908642 RepID=A0AA46YL90_9ACTN|nr:M50 family metallopeptidase [Solicola gregarius]UYM05369.1 M50 family metallopeptidase [Solicola gregarius]